MVGVEDALRSLTESRGAMAEAEGKKEVREDRLVEVGSSESQLAKAKGKTEIGPRQIGRAHV